MALSSTGLNPTASASGNFNPTPTNLGSASSGGGGSLTQGGALAPITTTQQSATSAPGFYMNFLNQLAGCAQTAAGNVQAVGAQPLQSQAFQEASQNAGAFQPQLNNAMTTADQAAGSCISQMAKNYMNPYINCVVNAIGNLGQNNINSVLAPQATAGIVGSGQFGSQRGAGALGSVLANAEQGITAQQSCALQKGYTQALCSANKQLTNQINAGKLQGCLATAQSNLGVQCSKNLAALGCQQYKMAQNQQMLPLCVLKAEGCALRGFTVPTAVSCIKTAPIPGAYATSPLATALGGATSIAGLFGKCGFNSSAAQGLFKSISCSLSNILSSKYTGPTANGINTTVTPNAGPLTDANGNPLPSTNSGGSGSGHMRDITSPDAPISLFSFADGGSMLLTKKSRRSKNTHKE